jgi:hypothetical protein
MLIKMGRKMPSAVAEAIARVRLTLLAMLDRGATGQF